MRNQSIEIEWPNGKHSNAEAGNDWLTTASKAGIKIPTGCLGGSCGACEIEVNGQVVRACISDVPLIKSRKVKVEFTSDPFW